MLRCNKMVVGILIGYLVLSFTLPIRRVMWRDTSSFGEDTLLSLLFTYHVWLSVMVLLFVLVFDMFPRPRRWVDSAVRVEFVNIISIVVLLSFLALTFLGIPGVWWTWLTLGIHVATVTLVANLLYRIIGLMRSVLLGASIAALSAGAWEILYHIAYRYFIDAAWDIDASHLYGQIRFILPLVIGGLASLVYYIIVHKLRLSMSRLTAFFLLLTCLSWALWLALGFWCDIVYDWSEGVWKYSEANYVQMAIYRSSKVWLALTVIGLFAQGGAVDENPS